MKTSSPAWAMLALLLAYIALIVLLFWAPRIKKRWKRWMRISSRLLGAVAATPLIVAAPVVLFGMILASGNPPAKTRDIVSADGQAATLKYYAGFLGRDYTEVILKQANCCRHTTVFWHQGPSWFEDTKIEWLDSHHLQISYHARISDRRHCEDHVNQTSIACLAEPWEK